MEKKIIFIHFFVKDEVSERIKNKELFKSHDYLKNKSLENILYNQYVATKKIFSKKKIPFRSFEIYKRDETSLGELFVFFILETILLGKALKINPYDQPSVELIKTETKRNLIS